MLPFDPLLSFILQFCEWDAFLTWSVGLDCGEDNFLLSLASLQKLYSFWPSNDNISFDDEMKASS
jgi:hypothetical protein